MLSVTVIRTIKPTCSLAADSTPVMVPPVRPAAYARSIAGYLALSGCLQRPQGLTFKCRIYYLVSVLVLCSIRVLILGQARLQTHSGWPRARCISLAGHVHDQPLPIPGCTRARPTHTRCGQRNGADAVRNRTGR